MRRRLAQLATTLFLLFIFWVIYMANTDQPMVFFRLLGGVPYGDKLSHFLLFGLLTLGANLGTANKRVQFASLGLPLGTVFVLIFVIFEELSQHFIASRTLDAGDALANFLGVAVFTWLSLRRPAASSSS